MIPKLNIFKILLLFNQLYSNTDWITLDNAREYAVSGTAICNEKLFVVHDNKNENQPRISLVNQYKGLKSILWPTDHLPFDLEALSYIPGTDNQFIAMESSGKCFRIFFKDSSFSLLNQFQLPELSNEMNLEGLALLEARKGKIKIVYGDRGSNERNSTLFFGDYDTSKDRIENVTTYMFYVSEPVNYRRNIADLGFDADGNLWTSATSDPGDDGPFETRIYKIGKVSPGGEFELAKKFNIGAAFQNQKVEGFVFSKEGLILMTDNENNGSSYLLYKELLID